MKKTPTMIAAVAPFRRDRDEHDDDRGDRRPRERDQIEQGDEQAERHGIRDAGEPESRSRRDAGDEADQQVAGDVAADLR